MLINIKGPVIYFDQLQISERSSVAGQVFEVYFNERVTASRDGWVYIRFKVDRYSFKWSASCLRLFYFILFYFVMKRPLLLTNG